MQTEATLRADTGTHIETLPGDGMNLVVEAHDADSLTATPATPMHQWFAGTFSNLPIDRDYTMHIAMAGKDVGGFRVQLWKWVGLRPMLSYADPAQYASYEWFARDAAGCWVSGDLFKSPQEREAGSGDTPVQSAIPQSLAPQFLSADGKFWYPWREIETAEAFQDEQRLAIRHRFDASTATVAIHVPYTYTYQQAMLARLQEARLPGVFIDDIGVTQEGRRLQIIRIDDPEDETPVRIERHSAKDPQVTIGGRPKSKHHRVMLVTAREHATEHSGSWVVQGALRALLADTAEAARLRAGTTWLLLLMFDPDGSTHSVLQTLTDHFFEHRYDPVFGDETPTEVVAYARYLRAFVNSGRPIHVTSAFYCLECNEAEPVCCPAATNADYAVNVAFNRFWFQRLRKRGYLTGASHPWSTASFAHRMSGWCSYYYGGMTKLFEVNERHPRQRLTLRELEGIGQSYTSAIVDFLETKPGKQRIQQMHDFLRDREKNMALWYRTSLSGTPDNPTVYDLLELGY